MITVKRSTVRQELARRWDGEHELIYDNTRHTRTTKYENYAIS